MTGQSALTIPDISINSIDHQFMAASRENGVLESNALSPNEAIIDRSHGKLISVAFDGKLTAMMTINYLWTLHMCSF